MTQGRNLSSARQPIEERESPGVLRPEALGDERWRPDRHRLGRRQPLARYGALLGDRAFLDGKQRFPRFPVQHENQALLGGLDDCRHHGPLVRQVHQDRLCGGVVVPDIMMDDLEVPDDLPGAAAQRDHRIGIAVFTGACAAIKVQRWTRRRQKHKVTGLVHGHDRPDVGLTDVRRAIRPPGGHGGIVWITRHRVECPQRFPGARIERAHAAAGRGRADVVQDIGTDHYHTVDDRRRRRDLHLAGKGKRTAYRHLQLAVVTKVATSRAGGRIDSK